MKLNSFQISLSFGSVTFRWIPDGGAGRLREVKWSHEDDLDGPPSVPPAWLQDLIQSFEDYFQHGRPLQPLPWNRVDTSEWTPFQYQVYQVASDIPFGETRSYGWIAERMGQPLASRAVGQALKRNPFLVIIPCHRVIPSLAQGKNYGGFMGKGDPDSPEPQLKGKLIELEESYRNPVFSFLAGQQQDNVTLMKRA